jgi:hypothetical protein
MISNTKNRPRELSRPMPNGMSFRMLEGLCCHNGHPLRCYPEPLAHGFRMICEICPDHPDVFTYEPAP